MTTNSVDIPSSVAVLRGTQSLYENDCDNFDQILEIIDQEN